MFEGPDLPKSLSEETFKMWLEEGRESKMPYTYLVIVWDELENNFKPIYLENREKIAEYDNNEATTGHETMVAAYDLYSESRITN
ncbi:MAG: hypothetical protein WBB45_19190 [Cyclobacteriaceae bacterium]